ncbi:MULTISPECIES: DUF2589 domain-containing protein [Burkholderia]|uniref:DUF2589 domain-containing protein n=1 Tax=Burkholderia TaxID=32008 RepID=UPI00075B63D5|nr:MULTISPECIES: DUF2589 domain-containing protein [Burkholderia]KVF19007.1 hypothetical protein WJ06_19625 [Burkholderia cepacia]KWC77056.1 hypothetical protein WL58_28305 [Burkholderia cepacia]KWE19117.1 hypothetical protein WL74_24895 [Burkholderia cepacia]MCA7935180.1 DUF2589 domain-containing protein [Burkholderia cepacia]MCA7975521.1 DUF2589 domain-containing protein [Burkholderia cepacia]
MTDSISPVVDLQYLFAAPIEAVIEADFMAARQFVRYVREFGFVRKPSTGCEPRELDDSDFGELRMITFFYEQVLGKDKTEWRRVQVPVLSLIPLPLLEVKTATFDFGVRLLLAERVKASCAIPLLPGDADDAAPRQYRWSAMLARGRPEAGGQTREDVSPFLEANIGAKVEVGQAGIPAGIGNLLALLGMNTQVGGAGTQATGEGGDHSRRES